MVFFRIFFAKRKEVTEEVSTRYACLLEMMQKSANSE